MHPQRMPKGGRKCKVPSQVSTVLPGSFWNLDPTAREVVQNQRPGRGTGVHKLTSIFHFGMPPTAKKEIQRIF